MITMSPAGDEVVIATATGRVLARWAAPVTAGHGLRLVREGGEELLWIADNGIPHPPGPDGSYPSLRRQKGQYGAAVKLSLEGDELLRLEVPPIPGYTEGNFAPTDVAVDEERLGGAGDIWLADGYGRHLVHRYDRHGIHLATLDGTEGLGRFSQPHGIVIDRRGQAPHLLIADRGNSRIQAFSLDGAFLGAIGLGDLPSPSGLAVGGALLYVADLHAGIQAFDVNGALVGAVAPGLAEPPPGWPNELDSDGLPTRPRLTAGVLNSPHGIAVDSSGAVVVSEWCIGGRLVRLDPRESHTSSRLRSEGDNVPEHQKRGPS
ncbi:MAG: hypothetical protein Q7V58_02670 [Actinomycetota bacterium]|nr:hypothetical protein [Actinomycetota bacterium]